MSKQAETAIVISDRRDNVHELPTIAAEEGILRVACDMFCRDGIHATGIDRILADAGASKITLYARFGSKAALLREVLLREGEEWREAFFPLSARPPRRAVIHWTPLLPAWAHCFAVNRSTAALS